MAAILNTVYVLQAFEHGEQLALYVYPNLEEAKRIGDDIAGEKLDWQQASPGHRPSVNAIACDWFADHGEVTYLIAERGLTLTEREVYSLTERNEKPLFISFVRQWTEGNEVKKAFDSVVLHRPPPQTQKELMDLIDLIESTWTEVPRRFSMVPLFWQVME